MRVVFAVLAGLICMTLAAPANAQMRRYDIGGQASALTEPTSPCVGPCGVVTFVDPAGYILVDGSISTGASAPVNIADYRISVGGYTFTPSNSEFARRNLAINPDGTAKSISLLVYMSTGKTAIGQTDPDARVTVFGQTGSNSGVSAQAYCTARSGTLCTSSDIDSTTARLTMYNSIGLSGPFDPIVPVPTLSEWAMILFGTILAGGAALYVQRRRLTA